LGLILLLGSFRNALGNVFRNSRNTLQNNSSVVQEAATNGGGTNTGTNNNGNGNGNGNGTNTNGFIIAGVFLFF